jgi:UDPglucose 6-dehydrogenase
VIAPARDVVIATTSTVTVDTNHRVREVAAAANPNVDFDVASNPALLRERAAIEGFMEPNRVDLWRAIKRSRKGYG